MKERWGGRDRQMGSEKWERWGERVMRGGRKRDRQMGSEKWERWGERVLGGERKRDRQTDRE